MSKTGRKPREQAAKRVQRMDIVPYLKMGMKKKDIAELCGVPVRTLYRWAQSDEVRAALGEIEESILEVSKQRATDIAQKAWDTLENLMEESADDRVRLDAAKTVLSRKGAPEQTATKSDVNHTGPAAQVLFARLEDAEDAARKLH